MEKLSFNEMSQLEKKVNLREVILVKKTLTNVKKGEVLELEERFNRLKQDIASDELAIEVMEKELENIEDGSGLIYYFNRYIEDKDEILDGNWVFLDDFYPTIDKLAKGIEAAYENESLSDVEIFILDKDNPGEAIETDITIDRDDFEDKPEFAKALDKIGLKS